MTSTSRRTLLLSKADEPDSMLLLLLASEPPRLLRPRLAEVARKRRSEREGEQCQFHRVNEKRNWLFIPGHLFLLAKEYILMGGGLAFSAASILAISRLSRSTMAVSS